MWFCATEMEGREEICLSGSLNAKIITQLKTSGGSLFVRNYLKFSCFLSRYFSPEVISFKYYSGIQLINARFANCVRACLFCVLTKVSTDTWRSCVLVKSKSIWFLEFFMGVGPLSLYLHNIYWTFRDKDLYDIQIEWLKWFDDEPTQQISYCELVKAQ